MKAVQSIRIDEHVYSMLAAARDCMLDRHRNNFKPIPAMRARSASWGAFDTSSEVKYLLEDKIAKQTELW